MLSAGSILANNDHTFYALKADHGKMLSADGTKEQIVNLIAGTSLNVHDKVITQQQFNNDPGKCKLKGHWWQWFSPVAVEIIDQNGSRAGIAADGSIQNDIPGADYEVWGEHKFMFLPTDENQTYTANLQGTGTGTFTFKAGDIENDEIAQTEVFSNIPVSTSLRGKVESASASTILQLDTNGDGTIDQTLVPTSLLDKNQAQDVLAPITAVALSGTQGQPGFYRSNVAISLSAQDAVIPGRENETSGILNTQYSLDGGEFQLYSGAVNITAEGDHSIKLFSIDKAGNKEVEQTVSITIDKTLPEISLQFDPTLRKLIVASSDSVDQTLDSAIATDQAGNITKIKFTAITRKQDFNAAITEISYNDAAIPIKGATIRSDWMANNQGIIISLNQKLPFLNHFSLTAAYTQTLGRTVIIGTDNGSAVSIKLDGLRLLQLNTDRGNLRWSY